MNVEEVEKVAEIARDAVIQDMKTKTVTNYLMAAGGFVAAIASCAFAIRKSFNAGVWCGTKISAETLASDSKETD